MIKHKHHIIPKHMGGTDDPSNLIELTIEEHAEAHKKLYEEYGKVEDKMAWLFLSGQISTATARAEIARSYMKNRVITDEMRNNMSKGQKERFRTQNHPLKGKKFSEESRKKMSLSHKGQIPVTKGTKKTEEQKEKDRQAQMKVPKYKCSKCGKECRGKGNLHQHERKHMRDDSVLV